MEKLQEAFKEFVETVCIQLKIDKCCKALNEFLVKRGEIIKNICNILIKIFIFSQIILFLPILIILFIPFLPTFISIIRKHKEKMSIFVINLFLGWTLIGWVVALAKSLNSNIKGN